MPKLTMTKWLPASGKSTRAKEMVEANPWKVKRVNKDDLRAMLDNSKHTKGNENYILRMRDMIIRDCLSSWLSIIVDDTNFNPIHEERLREIAKSCDAEFDVVFFDTPLNECIERDRKRENSVGANVILSMWKEYLYKPIEYKEELEECIICDIDWTLATKGDRDRYDESKVWVDLVIPQIKELVNRERRVFLVSWRHETCRKETEERLENNRIKYDWLYMRWANDNREDSIVKKEIREKFFKDKWNVKYVVDDRLRVLEMWVSLWLFTINVNQWNIRF